MPVDDYRRRVSDTLSRADSLFGEASAPPGLPARRLSEAADALRRRAAADDMSGLAATGYSTFADRRASELARLADTETALDQIMHTAASAENTAKAASRSNMTGVAAAADGPAGQRPAAERAVIASLQSRVGRQQQLVQRHQQQAAELAEQLRLLSYD